MTPSWENKSKPWQFTLRQGHKECLSYTGVDSTVIQTVWKEFGKFFSYLHMGRCACPKSSCGGLAVNIKVGFPHSVFWDEVSHWTWSPTLQLGWVVNGTWSSPGFHHPGLELLTGCNVALGIQTQVFMLRQQIPSSLSYPQSLAVSDKIIYIFYSSIH